MTDRLDHVDVGESVSYLRRRGKLSDGSAALLEPLSPRRLKVPNMDRAESDPQFVCLLLDGSGSMGCCEESVIAAQNEAIDALRGSASCRGNALYVSQYLFNEAPHALQEFTQLNPQGSDDVLRLTAGEYHPAADYKALFKARGNVGNTALYQTVHRFLQDVTVLTADSVKKGLRPFFVVGLCTDGKDTEGGVDPEAIKQVLQELRQQGYFLGATVIGFESSEVPTSTFEEIQQRLGFDRVIICSRSSPKGIRDALCQWSQSIVAFGKKS